MSFDRVFLGADPAQVQKFRVQGLRFRWPPPAADSRPPPRAASGSSTRMYWTTSPGPLLLRAARGQVLVDVTQAGDVQSLKLLAVTSNSSTVRI